MEFETVSWRLLEWYDRNARDLPWRHHPGPYEVWVSEIMLQQTRVETVMPYYTRFMKALPTVRDLAFAEEGTLLKLWEGLGYYSRVRNLQKGARMVMEDCGGRLPPSYEGLLKLPGIGDYTAGSIASIAFGIPVPAVDGNCLRVLARLLGCHADITNAAIRNGFRRAAARILPENRPGDFNQAVMDLGATVCLPNGAPKCDVCPLAEICRARLTGQERQLPVRAGKKPRKIVDRTILAVVSDNGKLLLRRRPANGLLARMWELPGVEGHVSPEEAAASLLRLPVTARYQSELPEARHIFTHLEWRMRGYLFHTGNVQAPAGCVWADETSLRTEYALPSAFRPYLRILLQSEKNGQNPKGVW